MPKHCELTGKKSKAGQNVAHSNVKTKRRFDANLQRVHLASEVLGRSVPMRISTRALRTVQKNGGLDAWLLSTDDAKLAPEALRLKRQIRRKVS